MQYKLKFPLLADRVINHRDNQTVLLNEALNREILLFTWA